MNIVTSDTIEVWKYKVFFLTYMNNFLWAILATFGISLISLVSLASLKISHQKLQGIILYLLALAAGTLLADAFLHLLPESIEKLGTETSLQLTFFAFFAFFGIEKIFQWHHCHEENCHVHSVGYMNLIGDSIHNFIDGLIIAASFAVSIPLGISTTMAIALHELPQEFGDFGVLLHAGFSKRQAILSNFFVALVAMFGVIVGNVFSTSTNIMYSLLSVAAGGFLYIATADLLPEIRNEQNRGRLLICLIFVSLGVGILYLLTLVE